MKPNDLPYDETLVFEQNDILIKYKQYAYKTKPHKRTILVNYTDLMVNNDNNHVEITKTEQRYIDVPELIFLMDIYKYKNNIIRLKQLKVFISENNKLYYAQFLNLYDNGEVCLGNNILKNPTLTPKDVINYFWNSTFDSSIGNYNKWEKGFEIDINNFIIKEITK